MGSLTFGIIKPDAVRGGKVGAILQRITDGGFKIRAMKLIHMTLAEAEGFYAVHRERPFFPELTTFMSSGPCVARFDGRDRPGQSGRRHVEKRVRRLARRKRRPRL